MNKDEVMRWLCDLIETEDEDGPEVDGADVVEGEVLFQLEGKNYALTLREF